MAAAKGKEDEENAGKGEAAEGGRFASWVSRPLPPYNSHFFAERAERERRSLLVTTIGGWERIFERMYLDWLEAQPMDPKARRACRHHIRSLEVSQRRHRNRDFTVRQWIDFSYAGYIVPDDLEVLLPPDAGKTEGLGMAEAYKHLLTLVRARLLHAKNEGEIDIRKFTEIDGALGWKEETVKYEVASIKARQEDAGGEEGWLEAAVADADEGWEDYISKNVR